jgi:hypothetical protein
VFELIVEEPARVMMGMNKYDEGYAGYVGNASRSLRPPHQEPGAHYNQCDDCLDVFVASTCTGGKFSHWWLGPVQHADRDTDITFEHYYSTHRLSCTISLTCEIKTIQPYPFDFSGKSRELGRKPHQHIETLSFYDPCWA